MTKTLKEIFLFDYRADYRDYLADSLTCRANGTRGIKMKLARCLGCQSGFLSQVLGKHGHFNLEHGEKVNAFLEHTSDEAHYFLLLIQKTRAGTRSLAAYFDKQLQEIVEQRLVLRNRIQATPTLSLEDQSTYYGAWYYGAIRVLLTIPEFQQKEKIAERLHFPLAKVAEVLEFLLSRNLAKMENGRPVATDVRMHLGNESSMIAKHHTNWRNRSMVSLDFEKTGDLHYSSVVSLSAEDATKFKEMTIQFIERAKALVRESPAEKLYALNIDFFEP